ncbi:sensor histidine kinase [Pseudoduganella danionis]|uniref:histidine kinase n=1 Tax=Pseudoduganella danionis TaxID=1890295 RepID=A0ABW9SHQ1_9BURK|nr:HAMP domain-containing sensor histidine kinase [Pseudoduganella danionis]MTW31598.1 sensor histidine kinase [Pseudoduganella danionis]
MSASEIRPPQAYAATGAAIAGAELQLRTLRVCLSGHEMLHLRPVLAQLQTAKLNASQKLELEAFQLLDRAANLENVAEALLMPAKSLQLQAQTEQHPLAQAAAFRALHWVQMRMRLHHAALDSLARAAELYERCALPELVVQMKAARCRVMLSAEMHEELRQFCATMLAQSDTLSPAIYTTLLDYSASASYYLALEEGNPVKADQHWSDCLSRRVQVLQCTRKFGLESQECVALLNLAVVSATREQTSDSRHYMQQVYAKYGNDGYWEPWLHLCRLLIQCAEGERQQAWADLLAYDATLARESLHPSRLREISLYAIRRYGRRWGYLEQALQATIDQVAMERYYKRELSTSLGETLTAVMERPQLLYQNALLAQHGTVLENSLVQRNQELQQTLDSLQREVAVRQAAEKALQAAHDRLEQEVRERTAALEQAMHSLMQQEKQLGLSRLVVGMAHELNTPLGNARVAASAITEQAASLQQTMATGSLRRSQLDRVLDDVLQGGALVDRALYQISQLVDRFKSLSGEPAQEVASRFDLSDRLRYCADNWRPQLHKRGITLTLAMPEQLWLVGYPGACQIVFQHLLDNCLMHAFARRTGGNIVVRTALQEHTVIIDWIDDGCGIAPEHLSHVFEPFFTTQLGLTGTGLGLASVHSMIVSMMRGQVILDSTPGIGSHFQLRLPDGLDV